MNATGSMVLNSDSISQNDKPNIKPNHTVQLIPYGVILYAHKTNETVRTSSPIVHSSKLSEKGVSKHLSQFPISRGA